MNGEIVIVVDLSKGPSVKDVRAKGEGVVRQKWTFADSGRRIGPKWTSTTLLWVAHF